MELGMFDRAEEAYRRLAQIHPSWSFGYTRPAWIAILRGRREESQEHVRRMFEVLGENPSTLNSAARLAAMSGDAAGAVQYYDRAGSPEAGLPVGLTRAWAYQQTGAPERAAQLLAELSEHPVVLAPEKKPLTYIWIARLRLLQGDREEALRQLELGVRSGWSGYYVLPSDPVLRSMRGDPRFDHLMARVKAELDRQRARVEREGW
jgi:tetratricopeptide (TPR) repeat protein